jgi:hypothetical protein
MANIVLLETEPPSQYQSMQRDSPVGLRYGAIEIRDDEWFSFGFETANHEFNFEWTQGVTNVRLAASDPSNDMLPIECTYWWMAKSNSYELCNSGGT